MEESSKKRGRPLRWFLIGAVTLGVLALAAWFVVFRVLTLYYIGYVLLVAYIWFAITAYLKRK